MSDPHAHAPTPADFVQNEEVQADPHGFSATHHHGHVIISAFTLRLILTVLLMLTGVTVMCALGETWIATTFDITFPAWVNVAVAMSIATVKSVIVAAYFMQLKYDNPINTIIFLFCLFALALFIGFTALDLTGRGHIYLEKSGEIVQGGTGGSHLTRFEMIDGKRTLISINQPITVFARENRLERVGPDEFARQEAEAHGGHGHGRTGSVWTNSTNQSRPRTGITPGLFDTSAPHDAHGDHAPDDHAPAPVPAQVPAASGGH